MVLTKARHWILGSYPETAESSSPHRSLSL